MRKERYSWRFPSSNPFPYFSPLFFFLFSPSGKPKLVPSDLFLLLLLPTQQPADGHKSFQLLGKEPLTRKRRRGKEEKVASAAEAL